LFRAADRALKTRYGITTAQHGALLFLEKNSGVSSIELAEAVGLKRAATSGLVDRMEAKGLIERRPSENDKRSLALSLSPKGQAILIDTKPMLKQVNADLLAGFNTEEQAIIARALKAIEAKANADTLFNDEKLHRDYSDKINIQGR
jgi:DNA-binding MarR family transcriptional regulator